MYGLVKLAAIKDDPEYQRLKGVADTTREEYEKARSQLDPELVRKEENANKLGLSLGSRLGALAGAGGFGYAFSKDNPFQSKPARAIGTGIAGLAGLSIGAPAGGLIGMLAAAPVGRKYYNQQDPVIREKVYNARRDMSDAEDELDWYYFNQTM